MPAPTRTPGSPRRRGFSMVEVLIAVAIGAVVIGGVMLMYFQGNKQFYKTTEHISLRGEAILLLERIARDLDEIVVHPEDPYPGDSQLHILKPYRLLDPEPYKETQPDGSEITLEAGKSLEFYRFHHLADGDPLPGTAGRVMPKMVARKIVYSSREVDNPDGTKSWNLYRNGKKLNTIPLGQVLFHKEPPIVAVEQLRGSPHAILTVSILPQGGMWGHMGETKDALRRGVLQNLQARGSLVSRTFHLRGYESMYTEKLFRALQLKTRGKPMKPFYTKVLEDAYTEMPPAMVKRIEELRDKQAPPTFHYPASIFAMEDKDWDDEGFAEDQSWFRAKSTEGVPVDPKATFGDLDSGLPAGQVGSGTAGSGSAGSGSSGDGGE